ncbi:MAG: Rieske (2Fe-2S) protein [Gemmatimonadota bacterium]|nr:Rieske (2Fe-2S) protein [Gemmatimonadota bacterium]
MRKKRRTGMPRRRFLIQMALGTGFVASGLSACATAANFRTRLAEDRVVLPRAELDEKLRADDVVLVTAEGLPESIILIRVDGDAYRALGSRCTHLGCEVRPGKHALSCPCHGSVFDLEGKAIRGPAQSPLSRYAVDEEGTDLVILLNGKE